jgi:hypothetical protein
MLRGGHLHSSGFGDVRVAVSLSSDLNGIVGAVPGIDEFIGNQVKRPTARQLAAMIDQRSVRELVAAQLRRALDALGIGTIREVRFVGSSLLIRHLPV